MKEFLEKKLSELAEAHAHAKREADELYAKAEEARRACVVPGQVVSHLEEAMQKLRKALEWCGPDQNTEPIPL